jgi:hypothetical protein
MSSVTSRIPVNNARQANPAQRFYYSSGLQAVALVVACQAVNAADPPSPAPAPPLESVVVTTQKLAVETPIDREQIAISLHRSTSHQREHYDYTDDSFFPAAATSYSNLNLLEDHATTELGMDYALPLSKMRSLKLGYAFEQDDFRNGNAGNNVDPVTGIQTVDPNVTNDFKFRQQINAGYASYQDGHILPKLAYSVSGNLFHSQIDATAFGAGGLKSTTGVNAKLKLDYRPTSADSVQLTVTRTDKRLTPQGYVSAINIVNVGYKRQVKPGLTAIATLSDIFNGQRYERFESTPTFTGDYLRAVQGRVFYIGLIYSLGSAKTDKPASFEYDQGA